MTGDPRPITIRVWDPVVRLLHGLLAVSVITAFLTREGGGALHEWAGYLALAAAAARLVWGFVGAGEARFSAFVRGPGSLVAYLRALFARRAGRYLGHNPAGGWMILLLLATTLVASGSGWLYITEAYWGVEWVERLHAVSGQLFLILVPVHVLGVVVMALLYKENLLAAMVHGDKAAPSEPVSPEPQSSPSRR